jgi:hypothetical protein
MICLDIRDALGADERVKVLQNDRVVLQRGRLAPQFVL